MSGQEAVPFARIEDAVAAIARGEVVVVVDDEDRENEGDLIMAAVHATPERIAFYVKHTSGLICAPLSSERADALQLPLMVTRNTESMGTAFTVSVDLAAGTADCTTANYDGATNAEILNSDNEDAGVYYTGLAGGAV